MDIQKKILVTGGAGFIGSNFLRYMIKKYPNYYFICVDNLKYAYGFFSIKNLISKPNFKFYKIDIRDRDIVFDLFNKEKPCIVINFAAESHVDYSINNASDFLTTNIIGVVNLMDACIKYSVDRFHQVSTDEVYGDFSLEDKNSSFDEFCNTNPSNPYSASKAAADAFVKSYGRTHNLSFTISRCTNNYGPYQYPDKFIPVVITKLLSNESIPVYGKGENIRDWIYVLDHCSAIDLIIHKSKPNLIYNIGASNEMSNLDVIREIGKIMNKSDISINFIKDRRGHDLRYGIDSNKINEELGWQAKTKFNEGLKLTLKWYLNNKNWWELCKKLNQL
ncbi:MAG: dTDP-glucose 4,6-dehydratase [Anaerococcus sp.]|nr:dTDP-glucose 4,6-dehydratase [Anaerococcus sp.]